MPRSFSLFITITAFMLAVCCQAAAQGNQTLNNGDASTAVSFPATGCVYNWVNNNPAIGLAARGSGDIASFTAVNTGSSPITATITATPTPAGYAYIGNYGDGSISVINTASNTVSPPYRSAESRAVFRPVLMAPAFMLQTSKTTAYPLSIQKPIRSLKLSQ